MEPQALPVHAQVLVEAPLRLRRIRAHQRRVLHRRRRRRRRRSPLNRMEAGHLINGRLLRLGLRTVRRGVEVVARPRADGVLPLVER